MLVVGLGNPGPKYAQTPHNLGFAVVDELARRWGITQNSEKFNSIIAEHAGPQGKVWLMKPLTFMNLSGKAVQAMSAFFKVPSTSVLVVSDDLDLPLGALRLRLSGGAGGHNGLKSIIEMLGTEEFPRVRIGVGRANMPSDVYLLSKVPAAHWSEFEKGIALAADAVETILRDGMLKAMNAFNTKKDSP